LIHNFQTFDEEFWSTYKALEKIAEVSKFKEVKNTLLKIKKIPNNILELLDLQEKDLATAKQEILQEWQQKREESCIRGSKFHLEQELAHLGGTTKELKEFGIGGKFSTITTNRLELSKKGVYPELLLSRISNDGKLRIAGQADLVIVDGNDVYILDYKTSRSIDKKAFFDTKTRKATMMKYPLNNLEDSNFWHYTLQLSTYAWMIQKQYPEANIKSLVLIHYDHNGKITNYECEYRKLEVERMLAYYRNQIKKEDFKKSIQKMEF
jgi:ATP-dependent exoDNAse (exonuclease V) beta subunit